MGSHEDPRPEFEGHPDVAFSMVIGIAEGILVERYQVPIEQARAFLQSRATERGLPLVEAANWLITTDTLP
ncbi:ANTAR domain-containing protein [Kribbella sp. CA-253562]|uniref:ANTAR domain-containing protein n=1 Tax=Kribbella sp. CA-253562 TaxID=3239942 RepID=UPI003D90ADBA